jgi:branched-chain amino acid transport system ATP-binding protein
VTLGTVVLEVEGLSKHFGGVQAVLDLSFQVREGEILGVIGPNGSGKTTTFHLITGFHRPDRGQVRFLGRQITGLAPHAVCALGLCRTF